MGLYRTTTLGSGNGNTLASLDDVQIVNPQDNQDLVYDNTLDKWTNKTNILNYNDTLDVLGEPYDPVQPSGGTTVVANPSGTATDDLNKLQVGSTIYNIPSGGGINLSTSEQIIGTLLGNTLYARVVPFNMNGAIVSEWTNIQSQYWQYEEISSLGILYETTLINQDIQGVYTVIHNPTISWSDEYNAFYMSFTQSYNQYIVMIYTK